MRLSDLLSRLEDRPFRPFRIHLSDGTVLDVPHSWSIAPGRHAAVVATRFEPDEEEGLVPVRWRTVDLAHITQLSDSSEGP